MRKLEAAKQAMCQQLCTNMSINQPTYFADLFEEAWKKHIEPALCRIHNNDSVSRH